MAEIITFPDIESLIATFLTGRLDVPCYTTPTPTSFPDRSITVIRTGGASHDMIVDTAQISLDCRAKRRPSDALDLARNARAELQAAARDGWLGDSPCYSCDDMSGPYLNPDPVNPGLYRFTAIQMVAVRGVVA